MDVLFKCIYYCTLRNTGRHYLILDTVRRSVVRQRSLATLVYYTPLIAFSELEVTAQEWMTRFQNTVSMFTHICNLVLYTVEHILQFEYVSCMREQKAQ
jgi:hypothetical protein